MMCAEVRQLIDAHLDRELDLRADLEVAEHLKSCSACTRTLEGRRGLSSAIREADLYRFPSITLTNRVRAALEAEAPSTHGTSFFSWPLGWNVAAVAVVAAAVVVTVLSLARLRASITDRAVEGELVTSQVVAGHIRSLLASHLTDVASTDQHTVKPWFQGKLDFAPLVVDLAMSGNPLIGARLDYIAGRPVAALVYRRNSHIVNLFEWPAAGNEALRTELQQGYNVVRWTEKGMAFRAVSDVNETELREFVERLRRAIP